MTRTAFDWLEFHPRPKKDGLHDSGYRFLRLVGVNRDKQGEETRTNLHQWSDHVVLGGPVNIDVTSDGTIRLMPWLNQRRGWVSQNRNGLFYSSAIFDVAEEDRS